MDIYVDTADLDEVRWALTEGGARGVTTNPTLMRRAGVTDYLRRAAEIVVLAAPLPVSLEVIADEPDEMLRQARRLAALASNVYVKIPVVNSRGYSCLDVVRELVSDGHLVNVTALMTVDQYLDTTRVVCDGPHIVSVFAGRIADTGRDPSLDILSMNSYDGTRGQAKLLWASVREIYNVMQAQMVKCDIVTLPPDLMRKLALLRNKDLLEFSTETAAMFYRDAVAAGYVL